MTDPGQHEKELGFDVIREPNNHGKLINRSVQEIGKQVTFWVKDAEISDTPVLLRI